MKFPLTREQQLDLYYFMKLNRQLEEQMVRLFRQNKIVGGLYSSLGQEAISVGTAYALEKLLGRSVTREEVASRMVAQFAQCFGFTVHAATRQEIEQSYGALHEVSAHA